MSTWMQAVSWSIGVRNIRERLMRIEFVSLFPRQVESIAAFGVVGRAVEKGSGR